MSDHDRTMSTKTILDDYGNAHEYTCVQHPAGEGFDLLPKITQIFGESLGNVMGAVEGFDMSSPGGSKFDGEALGNAFRKLAENVIAAGSHEFLKRILKHTSRGSGDSAEKVAANFDKIYQGNYGELFAAVAWVLEVNYAPFLKKRLGGVASKAKGDFRKKLNDLLSQAE